jgi:hypothetical protein
MRTAAVVFMLRPMVATVSQFEPRRQLLQTAMINNAAIRLMIDFQDDLGSAVLR